MGWWQDFVEIRQLLKEAYDHAVACDCYAGKSSEAAVAVGWPNYWDDKYDSTEPTWVEIYSYTLGPSRTHRFGSMAEALTEVRRWHRDEMARSHDHEGAWV